MLFALCLFVAISRFGLRSEDLLFDRLTFTLGSAMCGAAPSLDALVGFRAFQGLGGAFLMALSPAMLTSAFPAHERGRALGLNAVIVALGVSTGPTLGGILTESFTWRAIFYVNVPIGLLGAAAAATVSEPVPPK